MTKESLEKLSLRVHRLSNLYITVAVSVATFLIVDIYRDFKAMRDKVETHEVRISVLEAKSK